MQPRKVFRWLLAGACLLLAACSSGGQWQHGNKTIHEFAADDKECQQLALARAKEASLVPSPVMQEYLIRYDRCLRAQGWSPLESAGYAPLAVKATVSDHELGFSTNHMHLTLPGTYQLLENQHNEFLVQADETYLYFIFQLDYPQQLVREMPPRIGNLAFFARYRQEKIYAEFFTQTVDDQLIFSCTAYLYIDNHNRIVVSYSRAFRDMPTQVMALPRPEYDRLRVTQQEWENNLHQLAEQI